MTSEKLIHGYLDRLRENLETLDEQIVNARKMSKRKGKDSNALQWAKTLRDLVELRNTTLANIKAHLLGRDETGATNEPDDVYAGNAQVEYERYFRNHLSPWTQQDLNLKCEDCDKQSEEASTRTIETGPYSSEQVDLCDKCYEKRTEKESDDSESNEPISEDSSLEGAMTAGVRNIIRLARSDGDSPAEKIKTLEEFKAKMSGSADERGLANVLEPGFVLLDKEIERLQKEAEPGKGQDAAGKPAT